MNLGATLDTTDNNCSTFHTDGEELKNNQTLRTSSSIRYRRNQDITYPQ